MCFRQKPRRLKKKSFLFLRCIFEEAFFNEKPTKTSVTNSRMLADWFKIRIEAFKENDQVGTAGTYQTTINSIAEFKKGLQLYDITPAWLLFYEKQLKSENKSLSTINIYMRNLRAVINYAIKEKVFSKDNYPFTGYEITSSQNVKKALKDFDINQILTYKPTQEDHQRAIDFWIFSYLCTEMNFSDIIALKPQNMSNNFLSFYRQKTIRTKKKDLRPIKVGLHPRALSIIGKYKNTDRANPYLFPILEAGLSAKTIKNGNYTHLHVAENIIDK